MKHILRLCVLFATVSCLAQTPFGFEKGMTKQQLVQKYGAVAAVPDKPDHFMMRTAPRPHPDYHVYAAIVSPKDGLLKISAIGKEIQTDSEGTQIRAKYDEVVSTLARKYGWPDQYDNCGENTECEDQFWAYSIYTNQRSKGALWLRPESAFPVVAIEVTIRCITPRQLYIVVRYEFAGFTTYANQNKAAQDSVY